MLNDRATNKWYVIFLCISYINYPPHKFASNFFIVDLIELIVAMHGALHANDLA